MRAAGILLFACGVAMAQPPSGKYSFAALSVRAEGAKGAVTAISGGGSLSFDGSGQYRFDARIGAGQDAAQQQQGSGSITVDQGSALWRLTSPLDAAAELQVRVSTDGEVLIATSKNGNEFTYDLLVAVRAPASAASFAGLSGEYAGAYMALRGAERAGLATGFLRFTADGNGSISGGRVTGHAAAIDDVDRQDKLDGSRYSLRDDGSGTIEFASTSDVISGSREVMVSATGMWLVGFSAEAGGRDILIATRRQTDAAVFTFRGDYWLAELHADRDFVFDAAAAQFANAAGVLTANGAGRAFISEAVRSNGRRQYLTTINSYFFGTDGVANLGRNLSTKPDNFALAMNGSGFVGATVGATGDLTLEHGLMVGVRAGAVITTEVGLLPIGIGGPATLAPGAPMLLSGINLSRSRRAVSADPLPAEADGVRVMVGGKAAAIRAVSPEQIVAVGPSGLDMSATVQVDNNGKLSNTVQADVATTNPMVTVVRHSDNSAVTAQQPAIPGEVLAVLTTGLGAVDPALEFDRSTPQDGTYRVTDAGLKVYFDGVAGEVRGAALVPGLIGIYRIDVMVPEDAAASSAAVLGVATSDAFTDLTEIAISR